MKLHIQQHLNNKKAAFSTARLTPFLYIAPIFILLILFLLMPLGTAFVKSFYRYDGLRMNEFIGFGNYVTLAKDPVFRKSMGNLFFFLLGMHLSLGTTIAAAKQVHLLTGARMQYFMRSVFIVPMVVPSVVGMMLWKFIYYPNIGVVARIAQAFNWGSPNLLGSSATVIPAIISVGFPWIAGLNFILIYSALQSIDPALIEAARLDGASTLKTFFKVELPVISGQIKALYILAIIGQFQEYERVLLLTGGGPANASLIPGLHMYNVTFAIGSEAQYGYGCAIAVVLFILTLTLSKLLLGFGEKEGA